MCTLRRGNCQGGKLKHHAVVRDQTLINCPRCTLEILGFSPSSALPTAHAISFFFPRDNPTSMAMVEAHLPGSFKAVSRVEFRIEGMQQPTMLYLDDVRYTVYNVTEMGNGIGEVIHQEVVNKQGRLGKTFKA